MDSIENNEKKNAKSIHLGENGEDSEVLININNLTTYFYTEEGVVKAVDGVSFDIFKDEVLGLVGETGCGKSVTALSILQLVRTPGKIVSGSVNFLGNNLLELSKEEMRKQRGKNITMIFQDPLNSLNPVISVGRQVSEVFMLHQKDIMKKELTEKLVIRENTIEEYKNLKRQLKTLENEDRVTEEDKNNLMEKIKQLKKATKKPTLKSIALDHSEEILKEVGIADPRNILGRYPHELSGGMRQRVMISMGLSCNPVLLIADEPTTALDVTIQAQILDLVKDLKQKFKTSILMITHDLGIIAEMCDRVAVMYSGNIIEYATAKDLFSNPRHPYTIGLLGAIPSIEKKDQKLVTIRGMVPNLIYPPSGCRFHPRCDSRLEICDRVKPPLVQIEERYYIACHLFDSNYKDSPKYQWEQEEYRLAT